MNQKDEVPNKELLRKLGPDRYHWAFNVQNKVLPNWLEAFEYAYELGFKNGQDYDKIMKGIKK